MRYLLRLLAQFALMALAWAFLARPLLDRMGSAAAADLLGVAAIYALGVTTGRWWLFNFRGRVPPSAGVE